MRHFLTFAAALVSAASVAGAQDATQPPARLPAAKIVADSSKAITVQNDRRDAVRFSVEAGRVEKVIGTVAGNSTATLELPEWVLKGKRMITVVAVAEPTATPIASYAVEVTDGRRLGLLVPPAEGLPNADSLLVALPRGLGNAATVTVENARSQPVSVFAEQGLRFVKLGEIAAGQRETLALPAMMVKNDGAVRVFARPLGATERATQALRVKEGDHIAVIVM